LRLPFLTARKTWEDGQEPVFFEMIEDMLNAIEKGASEKDDAI
jgi:hypothetical protein